MTEPHWLILRAVLLIHSSSLAEHGGRNGIRDQTALDSAFARPRNRFVYEPEVDLADLAASYSFGLTGNHPFHDGNKRISFGAAGTFLRLNGYRLIIEDRVDAIHTIVELAAGKLSEKEFAEWIRARLRKQS
jgi:death-on-curing protein